MLGRARRLDPRRPARGATVATGLGAAGPAGRARPDLRFAELRGNMRTRLAKAAEFDAIVAAAVAFERLGLGEHLAEVLSAVEMVPQVGWAHSRSSAAPGTKRRGSSRRRSSTLRAGVGSMPSAPSGRAGRRLRPPGGCPRDVDGSHPPAYRGASRRGAPSTVSNADGDDPITPRHPGRPSPRAAALPLRRSCADPGPPWQPEPMQNQGSLGFGGGGAGGCRPDRAGQYRLAGDEPATVAADDLALERDPTTSPPSRSRSGPGRGPRRGIACRRCSGPCRGSAARPGRMISASSAPSSMAASISSRGRVSHRRPAAQPRRWPRRRHRRASARTAGAASERVRGWEHRPRTPIQGVRRDPGRSPSRRGASGRHARTDLPEIPVTEGAPPR